MLETHRLGEDGERPRGVAQRRRQPRARRRRRRARALDRRRAVNEDGLKLTTYFGERDRAGGRFLADALIDVYARHELRTSVLLRGAEGFGAQAPPAHRPAAHAVRGPAAGGGRGRRARAHRGGAAGGARPAARRAWSRSSAPGCSPAATGDVALPRGDQADRLRRPPGARGGRPGLHGGRRRCCTRHGVAGRDGAARRRRHRPRRRRRARFFGRNAEVPLMVIAVGDGDARSPPCCPSCARCSRAR